MSPVCVHLCFGMELVLYSHEAEESHLYTSLFSFLFSYFFSNAICCFISDFLRLCGALIHKNSLKERCIAIDSFPDPLSLSWHNTNHILLLRKGTRLIAVMECCATFSQNWILLTQVEHGAKLTTQTARRHTEGLFLSLPHLYP